MPLIVAVAQHLFLVGPILLPKPLAGGPFVLLAQDVVVDVLEELELDRVAESLGRLQSVEDDPTAPAGEMLIEEAGGAAEDPRQVALPFVPLLGLEIAARDPSAAAVDRVEVIAERRVKSQAWSKSGVGRQRVVVQVPVEQPRGILGVILRIAATGQVADDARAALRRPARTGPSAGRAASCRRRSRRPRRSTCPGAALLPDCRSSSSIPKACRHS